MRRIIPAWSSDHLISQVRNVDTDIPFYLLFILWFAVCGGSSLGDPLTILSAFYLFFLFYGFLILFIISLANYCWHWHNVLLVIYSIVCSVLRIIPSCSDYLISQISNVGVGTDIPLSLLFILLFAVCWGSSLREPLSNLSARLIMLTPTYGSTCYLFYRLQCVAVLLVIYSIVCSVLPFYLLFILWYPDPLHHLVSQIIVDMGILFYLLFILWFAVCGGSYLNDLHADELCWQRHTVPIVIYSMVCSVWRIIPPWSSDHLISQISNVGTDTSFSLFFYSTVSRSSSPSH